MYTFPAFDPIALHLGPIGIHWYALMYVLGFLSCGLYFQQYYLKHYKAPFTSEDIGDIASMVFLGILFGGRLVYVLFYNFSYYLSHPLSIPAIWEGGLSFHGGLVGVIIALLWYCRKKGFHPIAFADVIVLPIPLAIGFGRLGNFINGELWGKPSTTQTWCMIFPHVDQHCRYPTQLFEALGEGVLLFFILHIALYCTKLRERQGVRFGLFLLGYGTIRSFIELFREPDAQLGLIWGHISMGQLLSIPVFMTGFYYIFLYGKKALSISSTQ